MEFENQKSLSICQTKKMEEWFNGHVQGYDSLEEIEKCTIYHFTLLWTLFEAQILNTNGNAHEICKAVAKLSDKVKIDISDVNTVKNYFTRRYISDGEYNEIFDRLDFRSNDKKSLVVEVLTGKNDNLDDQIIALLIIVLRLRNNFFHGKKWAYDINGQIENFKHANELLKYVLELDKKINPN